MQAFVNTELDMEVYIKLPDDCVERSDKVVKLKRGSRPAVRPFL